MNTTSFIFREIYEKERKEERKEGRKEERKTQRKMGAGEDSLVIAFPEDLCLIPNIHMVAHNRTSNLWVWCLSWFSWSSFHAHGDDTPIYIK